MAVISETGGSILDFRDLIQVKFYNDQLVTILNDWMFLGPCR